MQRQLFLHHYFPALYFAIIAFCQVLDFAVARVPGVGLKENPIFGKTVTVAFLVLSMIAFILFSPLAYGNPWTKSECNRVKLFSTWDFDCNTFLDSVSGIPPEAIPERKMPERGLI
jgi:dolichyl-phosphate-mannose-protein mannosyltransferase